MVESLVRLMGQMRYLMMQHSGNAHGMRIRCELEKGIVGFIDCLSKSRLTKFILAKTQI